MLACAVAGADVVDVAIDSMSGLTSQPAMGAVCAALEQMNLGTSISSASIQALNQYWQQVRILYAPFESNMRSPDSSVFQHQIPGGQVSDEIRLATVSDISSSQICYSKPPSLVWEAVGKK